MGNRNDRGVIDITHMTLKCLHEERSDLFNIVRDYKSFAIWRDPVSRFHSAMAQFIRNYSSLDYFCLSKREYEELCCKKLDYIEEKINTKGSFDYKNIHFTPQIEFIYFRGEKVINEVFVLKDINSLLKSLEDRMNISLDCSQKIISNRSLVIKSYVPRIVINFGRMILRNTSQNFKDALKEKLNKILLVAPDSKFDFLLMEAINSRIKDLYRLDYEILSKDEIP